MAQQSKILILILKMALIDLDISRILKEIEMQKTSLKEMHQNSEVT